MIFCAAGLPDLEERAIFAFIPETVKVDALYVSVLRFPDTESQSTSLRGAERRSNLQQIASALRASQ